MINFNKHKLPNLYIPGSGKSGTSSLHELLNCHPDICMSFVKEPHFWTSTKFESFIDTDLETYLNLFEEPEKIYFGESSTGYLAFPSFIKRIKENYTESPKFIVLLRNPVDRVYSHYWWLKGIGSESLSFKKAVLTDFDKEPDEFSQLPEANYKNYYQFGLYGKWISRFFEAFGKESVYIITTEQLKFDQLSTLNSCFEFLKLKKLSSLPEVENNKTTILRFPKLYKHAKKLAWGKYKINKILKYFFPKKIREKLKDNFFQKVYKMTATNKSYPEMSQNDRVWIKEKYVEDVALLKKISGYSFNEWKDFK